MTVTVDLVTPAGIMPAVAEATLEPNTPLRIELGGVAGPTYGARVSATGPIAAAVRAEGESGFAVMPGVATPARTWLLPGLRSAGLEEATLWMINTGEDAVTATVSVLTGGGLVGETVTVDAGTIYEFGPVAEGGLGYLVESAPSPISVAWSITSPGGTAFASGIPVTDG